jgi:hypothetical protein
MRERSLNIIIEAVPPTPCIHKKLGFLKMTHQIISSEQKSDFIDFDLS